MSLIQQRMSPIHKGTRTQESWDQQQTGTYTHTLSHTHTHTNTHASPVQVTVTLREDLVSVWGGSAGWNKVGHVGIMGHSDSNTHTYTRAHRANSVSCGNINVSSFIDDYSQQERGHLFNDSLSHPNTPTRQQRGREGGRYLRRKESRNWR